MSPTSFLLFVFRNPWKWRNVVLVCQEDNWNLDNLFFSKFVFNWLLETLILLLCICKNESLEFCLSIFFIRYVICNFVCWNYYDSSNFKEDSSSQNFSLFYVYMIELFHVKWVHELTLFASSSNEFIQRVVYLYKTTVCNFIY